MNSITHARPAEPADLYTITYSIEHANSAIIVVRNCINRNLSPAAYQGLITNMIDIAIDYLSDALDALDSLPLTAHIAV